MSEYTTDHDLQSYEDMVGKEIDTPPGSADCGYDCHFTKKYGFVPEAGCPVHD